MKWPNGLNVLVSELSSLDSSPEKGHCVLFWCMTPNPLFTSLHPSIEMGSNKTNAGGGNKPTVDLYSIQEEVEIPPPVNACFMLQKRKSGSMDHWPDADSQGRLLVILRGGSTFFEEA